MTTSGLDSVSRTAGPATGAAKALVKGLTLVDAVSARGGSVTPAALGEATGLPRSTVTRLLEALVEHRVLSRDAEAGYVLGPQVAIWGERYLDGLDLARKAEDLMAALAAETCETAYLGVRDLDSVFYIAKADGRHAVRPAARIGTRNPLHSTAMGKLLLAYATPDVVAGHLRGPLERRTENTITTPARLAQELAAVRERGFSMDDVENEEGVRCVAAPVRDHTGTVIAAMSVAAPAYRFGVEDLLALAPRLLAAAAELSERIGARGDQQADGGAAVSDESWRGKVGRLESDELTEFLGEARIARLACLDEKGWPYVVPCWHEWDGEAFWVVPRERSAWARYLEADPRCAITIDEDGAQRKVVAQCSAEVVERPNLGGRWLPVAERMSLRYLGENGPKYLEPTLGKKRWLFRLAPVAMQTWQGQDWAARYK